MKLFYFNPNTYGMEAFVCAESKEEAIKALNNVAIKNPDRPFLQEEIKDMVNCSNKYTIDEFEPNEVIFSEIS